MTVHNPANANKRRHVRPTKQYPRRCRGARFAAANSKEATLREAGSRSRTDHDVIQNAHTDEAENFDDATS